MLIAASNSHGVEVQDSASAVSQQSGSPDSQGVSLFDLLLSQFIAPSYQVNPAAPNEIATTNNLTNESRLADSAIPHSAKQKSTTDADSVATNPLTNLLFLSNGPAFQKRPTQTNLTQGFSLDRGNGNVISTATPRLPSITATLGHAKTDSVGTQTGPLTGKSASKSISNVASYEAAAAEPSADPLAPDFATTTKSQIAPGFQLFSQVPNGHPPISMPRQTLIAGHKQFEPAVARPDSPVPNVTTGSNSTSIALQANSIANVESVSVETSPAAVNSLFIATSVQRPVSHKDDADVPMIPTSESTAAPNIERPQETEVAAPLSVQLATAITTNLATVFGEGATTVHIKIDRQDLGTINLQLSINKNVVSVRIMTDNSQAQQIVEGQMNALRQSLTVSGIECGQFQVGCDSNNRQSPGQKPTGQSSRSAESLQLSRSSASGTLKFPVARLNDRVSFVA